MKQFLTIDILRSIAQSTLQKGCVAWLYGSRARGDERLDSDWDVLILLDKNEIDSDDFDRYSYPLIEKGWEYGADISPQYTPRQNGNKCTLLHIIRMLNTIRR